MHKKYINSNLMKISLPMLLVLFLSISTSKSQIPTSRKGNLRLITHNIWNGFTEVPEQKASWISWLNDKQPDVLALQELKGYTPEQLSGEARQWAHTHSALLKQEGFPTGITSGFPIEDVQRTLSGFHHGLLRARIQGIYFYVIHLHPSNWEIRRQEVELLLQDINTLPAEAHVVLAGDFNALSRADSIYYEGGNLEDFFYKRDQEINENNLKNGALDYEVINTITNYGFADTELEGRHDNYKFTGSFPTAVEKPGDHGENRRLDYVFVSPSLYQHISPSRIVVNEQTMLFSDHLPVLIDIRR
jgi:endonuclease/exonuclease/phosphatase family metal-dependent hydrolase